MTVAMAWVGTGRNGRKHLYMAADSRTRGQMVVDFSPKILTLPRSDCAICFAGTVAATYPLMLHLANAIEAHQPARDRSMDVNKVKEHLLAVFTDIVRGFKDVAAPLEDQDLQFIFAGYSWRAKDFRIWTIQYRSRENRFSAREALAFSSPIEKAAFVGDWATRVRNRLSRLLGQGGVDRGHAEFAPFIILRDVIREADGSASIGGAPQLIRVTEHLNTRVIAIRWPSAESGSVTLMGRFLQPYENTDNWILDPDSLKLRRPRTFGYRLEESEDSVEETAPQK